MNNKFTSYATENGWYDASSRGCSLLFGSRNYLNIKYIMAYELLHYNNAHTEDAVAKIMGNNSFGIVFILAMMVMFILM